MSNEKDELITAAELSRRIKKSPAYISKQSKKLKDAKCTYGKKFYYRKSAQLLGCDPDNPQETTQSNRQKEVSQSSGPLKDAVPDDKENKKQPKKEQVADHKKNKSPREIVVKVTEESTQAADKEFTDAGDEDEKKKVKDLLEQIKEAIDDPNTTLNRAKLDGLKLKASILTEYYKSLTEKIKNRKLEEDLFTREEVMKILSFSGNIIRNALNSMGGNYSLRLENSSRKFIKEFVDEDTNRILSDFMDVENKIKKQ